MVQLYINLLGSKPITKLLGENICYTLKDLFLLLLLWGPLVSKRPLFQTAIYLLELLFLYSPFSFLSFSVDWGGNKNLKIQLQFCTHDETSNKELFPTFARTRPPDTQISKSVASVLKAFHWHKVAFFHKSTDDSEYAKVSQSTQQHVTQILPIIYV